MSNLDWQHDWRAQEPRPDFARRVMDELVRGEEGGIGWGAPPARQRRAGGSTRVAPIATFAVAALLLTGAALGALGGARLAAVELEDVQQESSAIERKLPPPRMQLVTRPTSMEPERARAARPPRRASPPAAVAPAPPPAPLPIHYPPCHCSSGAVVCSCVD